MVFYYDLVLLLTKSRIATTPTLGTINWPRFISGWPLGCNYSGASACFRTLLLLSNCLILSASDLKKNFTLFSSPWIKAANLIAALYVDLGFCVACFFYYQETRDKMHYCLIYGGTFLFVLFPLVLPSRGGFGEKTSRSESDSSSWAQQLCPCDSLHRSSHRRLPD